MKKDKHLMKDNLKEEEKGFDAGTYSFLFLTVFWGRSSSTYRVI